MKKLRGVEGESLAVVSKRMRHYCSVKGRRDEGEGQVYEVVEVVFHALRVIEHLMIYVRMDSGLWIAAGRRLAGEVVGYMNVLGKRTLELVLGEL